MSITVFIADDHAVVRDGLRLLLESQQDIKIVGEAANGRDTVQQVLKLRPDVAVIDIAMPEQNGIEATLRISEACPSTYVIILSMHSTTEHIFRALQSGAKGYLLKESAGIEVVNAVRTVFEGQRYLSKKLSEAGIEKYIRQREIDEAKSPLGRLSSREREILQLVVEGKSSTDIANLLNLSPKTIETYRSRLMAKLGIDNLPGLIRFAIQHGLTPL
jgi:DNA-binding NarL/FixJ family response regulator